MNPAPLLFCDGCGQSADSQHVAIRLKRLEWATRFRPVHIHTLLLSDTSPEADPEFLYSPEGNFLGEAKRVLEVAGISMEGKSREAVHAEFQRAGFFLAHLLECPQPGQSKNSPEYRSMIEKRIPAVVTRIRRSLKPRRVALVSQKLTPYVASFSVASLECPVLLDDGAAYATDGDEFSGVIARLKETLASSPALAR
jgi:hypothetical protein